MYIKTGLYIALFLFFSSLYQLSCACEISEKEKAEPRLHMYKASLSAYTQGHLEKPQSSIRELIKRIPPDKLELRKDFSLFLSSRIIPANLKELFENNGS